MIAYIMFLLFIKNESTLYTFIEFLYIFNFASKLLVANQFYTGSYTWIFLCTMSLSHYQFWPLFQVSIEEARGTLKLWYKDRKEVLKWQEEQKAKALEKQVVHTLLGRARNFPWVASDSKAIKNHNLRAAINAPVQVGWFHAYGFMFQLSL